MNCILISTSDFRLRWSMSALLCLLFTTGAQADEKLEMAVQFGHAQDVTCAAFSRDGKFVVTGSRDETAIVWDAKTGMKLRTLIGHRDAIYCLAFSPDGKHLVTGSQDDSAIVWEFSTGKLVHTLSDNFYNVWSVTWSPDGKQIATGCDNGIATLWESETGRKLHTLKNRGESVTTVAYTPDGQRLLTVGRYFHVSMWDRQSGEQLASYSVESPARRPLLQGWIKAAAFHPDGKTFLTALEKAIVSWDVQKFAPTERIAEHGETIEALAISPDGKRFVSSGMNRTAIIWDTTSAKQIHQLKGHTDQIASVAYSSDGSRIVTGSDDGTAIVWNAESGERLLTLGGNMDNLSVSRASNGRYVAFARKKARLVWDLESGALIGDETGPASELPKGLALLAVDKRVGVFDARTGKVLAILQGHEKNVANCTFSPDGSQIFTSAREYGEVIVWDSLTNKQIGKLEPVENASLFDQRLIKFKPDGKQFMSCNHPIQFWDSATRKPVGDPLKLDFSVFGDAFCFSPDGDQIGIPSVTFDEDKPIFNFVLQSLKTGKVLQTLTGPKSIIHESTFSPDGSRIAAGSMDNLVYIWDAASGERLQVLRGHTANIVSVSYSPDGKLIRTGSSDGTIKVWRTDTGEQLATIYAFADAGNSWLVLTPDGRFDGSEDISKYLGAVHEGTLDYVAQIPEIDKRLVPGLFPKLLVIDEASDRK